MNHSISRLARSFSVLALGTALFAFSAASSARAQKKMPAPVALTPALLEKVETVSKGLTADATALQELQTLNHENDLDPTVAETDDAMAKKYPHLAAVYQTAGLKPHEFVNTLITLLVTNRRADDPATADGVATQANIDFVKANRDRVKAINKIVTGSKE